MSLISTQGASRVVSDLLRGAQLDSIRVYSLIVQLGFVCLGRAGNLPDEIWVSISGSLFVEGDTSMVGESESSRDFFARRASALGEVYRLIGQEVAVAGVSDSGALQIRLGGKSLRAEADDDTGLEDVWSVSSDSPDVTADHRWHVSLDDSGAISARLPS